MRYYSLCNNKNYLVSIFYVMGTILSTLHTLSHLTHQQTFDGECSSYFFFVNKEREVKIFGQGLVYKPRKPT